LVPLRAPFRISTISSGSWLVQITMQQPAAAAGPQRQLQQAYSASAAVDLVAYKQELMKLMVRAVLRTVH
jgi:hypothetical protein